MNQEWFCTSKVIAQGRAQGANLVFHQRSSDAIIVYDNMPAIARNNIVTLAGEVLFERESPT